MRPFPFRPALLLIAAAPFPVVAAEPMGPPAPAAIAWERQDLRVSPTLDQREAVVEFVGRCQADGVVGATIDRTCGCMEATFAPTVPGRGDACVVRAAIDLEYLPPECTKTIRVRLRFADGRSERERLTIAISTPPAATFDPPKLAWDRDEGPTPKSVHIAPAVAGATVSVRLDNPFWRLAWDPLTGTATLTPLARTADVGDSDLAACGAAACMATVVLPSGQCRTLALWAIRRE